MTPKGWLFVAWLSFSVYCIAIGVPSLVVATISTTTTECQQKMRDFLLGYGIAQCVIAILWLPLIACFDQDATLIEELATFPIMILALGSISAGAIGGGVGTISVCPNVAYAMWAMSLAIFILNLAIAGAAIIVVVVFAFIWFWRPA